MDLCSPQVLYIERIPITNQSLTWGSLCKSNDFRARLEPKEIGTERHETYDVIKDGELFKGWMVPARKYSKLCITRLQQRLDLRLPTAVCTKSSGSALNIPHMAIRPYIWVNSVDSTISAEHSGQGKVYGSLLWRPSLADLTVSIKISSWIYWWQKRWPQRSLVYAFSSNTRTRTCRTGVPNRQSHDWLANSAFYVRDLSSHARSKYYRSVSAEIFEWWCSLVLVGLNHSWF